MALEEHQHLGAGHVYQRMRNVRGGRACRGSYHPSSYDRRISGGEILFDE